MSAVLVTAIGSFSADIVIKNLKKLGYTVIGCDIYPREWIADSFQVERFYQAPYATHPEEYLAFIQKVCRQEQIEKILPLTDVEVDVFNANRQWFSENGVTLCISPRQTVDVCRNKAKLEEFIRQNGSVVKTIPTRRVKELTEPPKEFPVVAKPYDGRSSQGLHILHSEDEWVIFEMTQDPEKYIVQPYIPGDVLTVDVVLGADGSGAAVARKELLRTLNGAGTSVYVFADRALEDRCLALAKQLGIVGCVNFEFLRDANGNDHFIECNPRFSGGVEFSCIAGYDCVANHIRAFEGKNAEGYRLEHNLYIARKYEEYVTCMEP